MTSPGTDAPEVGAVVHLNDPDLTKQARVLVNIANLRDELGADTPVELVVHGPALSLALPESPHAAQLAGLTSNGLAVAACANSMRALGVSAEGLAPGARVVPSGVAHLVRRQQAGWAYLRP